MNILLDTLKKQGYDLDHPETLQLRAPGSLEEVQPFVDSLKEVEYEDDKDVRILLSTMICEWSGIFHTIG